ncbi:MAG: ABC transporter permease [Myxococcota bacterium]
MSAANPTAPAPLDPDIARRIAHARDGMLRRTWAVVRLALRMMLHDKAKLVGTVVGVVFAVLLSAQQLGILFGLLQKNTMFVDNGRADVWICPPGTNQLQPGKRLPQSVLLQARATEGVRTASALVYQTGSVQRPWGGSEPISLIGFDLDTGLGGPWNVVAGDASLLAHPDTMVFEDARREKMGALNLGSEREVNGYAVQTAAFTWGLLPFAPPYAFGAIDLVRAMTKTPSDEQHFVLVAVAPGSTPEAVRDALAQRLPETKVMTRAEFSGTIVKTLLGEQLGITFGTSTVFGLLIGFIIVALSMFSSVLDRLREFGTLKAIGVTNGDLSRLLVVQSIAYALIGSFFGLGMVGGIAQGIRSANLSMIVPWQLIALTPAVMTTLCILASALALRRVRKLEPGMVFR